MRDFEQMEPSRRVRRGEWPERMRAFAATCAADPGEWYLLQELPYKWSRSSSLQANYRDVMKFISRRKTQDGQTVYRYFGKWISDEIPPLNPGTKYQFEKVEPGPHGRTLARLDEFVAHCQSNPGTWYVYNSESKARGHPTPRPGMQYSARRIVGSDPRRWRIFGRWVDDEQEEQS